MRPAPAFPAVQPRTLKEAVYSLAPSDRLDRDHRLGEKIDKSQHRTLVDRKARAVKAALKCTRLACGSSPGEVDSQAMRLASEWLSAPGPETLQACATFLQVEFSDRRGKHHVVRGSSTPSRKAVTKLLQAVTAQYASAAASYAYLCAMAAVQVVEPLHRDQNGSPHAAHMVVAGIVLGTE